MRTRNARPRPSVLILEDEADAREVWLEALERAGYAPVAARNGLEALGRLGQVSPAVILLDMLMPDMDGFDFLANLRVRHRWHHVSVVILSAVGPTISGVMDRHDAHTLGVAEVLPKPVPLDALVQAVRRTSGKKGVEGRIQ